MRKTEPFISKVGLPEETSISDAMSIALEKTRESMEAEYTNVELSNLTQVVMPQTKEVAAEHQIIVKIMGNITYDYTPPRGSVL